MGRGTESGGKAGGGEGRSRGRPAGGAAGRSAAGRRTAALGASCGELAFIFSTYLTRENSSTMAKPAASDTAHHDDHHDQPATGITRWLFATNHKDIGTMYLVFSLIMFFIGGAVGMVIRA